MRNDSKKERPLGSSPLRIRALVRKEALQIIRDPSSIAIAFLLPIVLLLLFGYGVSLDAKSVPMALVVEKPSPLTQSFTAAFAHSPYFSAKHFRFVQEAEQAMMEGRVKGIVWLRGELHRNGNFQRAMPPSAFWWTAWTPTMRGSLKDTCRVSG